MLAMDSNKIILINKFVCLSKTFWYFDIDCPIAMSIKFFIPKMIKFCAISKPSLCTLYKYKKYVYISTNCNVHISSLKKSSLVLICFIFKGVFLILLAFLLVYLARASSKMTSTLSRSVDLVVVVLTRVFSYIGMRYNHCLVLLLCWL